VIPAPASPGWVRGGADRGIPGVVVLLAITGIWAWWGWRQGAFFGVVLYPGGIALLALLAGLLVIAPWQGRLRGGAAVAFAALLGLALWTLASIAWTPTRDVAVEDAARALVYAVSFGLGIWTCQLLGRRMLLSAAPLAVAAGLVAVATVITLWTGSDIVEYLEQDGTLRFPLGYRNAVCAFFLVAVFPMIVLASNRSTDWRLRALLLGSTTICLELAVLAQSRGSVFAMAIGLAVFLAVSSERLRVLSWLALAALPVLPALPLLLDVFQSGGDNGPGSLGPLQDAAAAMVLSGAVAVLIGGLRARTEDRIWISDRAKRAFGGGLLAICALGIAGVGFALATTEGGPVGFADRSIDEFTSGGTPELRDQGTRYGFNLGSNRGDFWRVSLDDAAGDPLLGTGAGGFQFSYLRERDSDLTPDDPHSVVMQMLGELGVPGLLLLLGFAAAATIGAIRSRRLGPSAAALSAAALGAGAYWLAQASIDWIWVYPAITAPVVMLLGAACAPALLAAGPRPPNRGRRLTGAALLVVAAISLVPLLLSERYANEGVRSKAEDPEEAFTQFDRAQSLNPWADRPALEEAVLAEEEGDLDRALAAVREAQRRKPDFWGSHYLAARILASTDLVAATYEIERARELNPMSPEVADLADELEAARGGESDTGSDKASK
jgi:hypothetical protein